MLTGSSAILATLDVPATVSFYSTVLGFPSTWSWGEPPSFGAATWGKVTIMFSLQPHLANRVEGHQLWVDVEDVDALNELHLERGAMIVSAIEDKPWGRREYTVRDPNGYHLRFAGMPGYTKRGSGLLPQGVQIVRRIPTLEEFERIAGREFYSGGLPTGVLERSWAAVVAEDPTEGVIGTVRIMYDAPGWFSIWDVAVLPEWQGQNIGTSMMKAALEIVREESPGANVYLFTFKHEFYEKVGFAKETVDLVRL